MADGGRNNEVETEDVDNRHTSDDNTPKTMNDIQEHRRRLLSDGCREFSHIVNRSTQAWYQMFYDDQIDYVFCPVSKSSCTNLKRTLIMLTGKIAKFNRPEQLPISNFKSLRKYIKTLANVRPEYRNWRFKDSRYFTFFFVREPLERLVSAYRDKLVENPGYNNVDRRIVRQYRPREYNASVKRYNVTFAEFVRYVLNQHGTGNVLDRHWIPQSEVCRVCQYRWDFIGHHETLVEEANYVVSKLKSRIVNAEQLRRVANITFPADSGHRKSSDFLQQMYASVPAADVQALYQLYAVDYALFGFKHPNVTGFS